jgi:predicted DNA-binding protein
MVRSKSAIGRSDDTSERICLEPAMDQSRSLRTLLVVNSLLAGGLLWTITMGDRGLLPTAEAAPQYRSTRSADPPEAVTGVGNAAARQRAQMIKHLEDLSKRLEKVESTLASGDVEVRIRNVDDFAIDYDRLARAIRDAAGN